MCDKKARRCWLWSALIGAGILLHAGTALLRLDTFFPYPQLVDFAAFYAGAWAVRLDTSPYEWHPAVIEYLRTAQGLRIHPPVLHSPPTWAWLLQPLTLFDFPTATFIWLVLLLGLVIWSAFLLARTAGWEKWPAKGLILLLVLTFGPVFLNLTLGQNSLFLLMAVLVTGHSFRSERGYLLLMVTVSWIIAISAKLFPLIWLLALLLLRRRRWVAFITVALLLFWGWTYLLTPAVSQEYWSHFLPGRSLLFTEQVGIDDQSLVAWLDRLGRPHTFGVPGLSATQQHTVTWSPPWSVDPLAIRVGGYFLAALLAIILVVILLRTGLTQAEGAFYLWVLYGLIIFPHMERYNHVLLLPAMAWLWKRGGYGHYLVILAYLFTGLSRLTHLWAILFPAPWGPLCSGFGLYAVLLLMAGMILSLRFLPERSAE